MRISVLTSEPLRTAILGMRGFSRDLQKQTRQRIKPVAQDIWKTEVGARPATKLENRALVATATVAVRNSNIILQSGGKGKLAKVLPAKAVEFGADREVVVTYATISPKGTRYKVTRHTQRQLPNFAKRGHLIYQAAAGAIPRLASFYVQTVKRTFFDNLEGK